MKRCIDDLACFGGHPLFGSPRPIGQLSMPPVDEYLGVLRQSLEERHLTNGGPLVRRLEERLAEHHGAAHCVTVANAGLGLTMLLQIFAEGRQGEVIMPGFSYRGLPHFARWAGQQPRFCDVDPKTHFLDLEEVGGAVGPSTTSVLGVSSCHAAGDVTGLCSLATRHGLPVVIDAVYAATATRTTMRGGRRPDAEVYSLHVTKLLAGFEGGYVITDSAELADVLAWQRNFALPTLRPTTTRRRCDHVWGMNGKLNEFHAAAALLALEMLPETVAENKRRYAAYESGLAGVSGLCLLRYESPDTANFQLAIVSVAASWPLSRDATVDLLRAEGMAIGPYYSPPLHVDGPGRLPVAEALAGVLMQLPVGAFVSLEDIDRTCDLLGFVSLHGPAIAERLRKRTST